MDPQSACLGDSSSSSDCAAARLLDLIPGSSLIDLDAAIADSKRRAIREEAAALRLGGMVKHGWPGVIVVEGLEEDVREYERRLRRFQWQHLQTRGEESQRVNAGESAAAAAVRSPPPETEARAAGREAAT